MGINGSATVKDKDILAVVLDSNTVHIEESSKQFRMLGKTTVTGTILTFGVGTARKVEVEMGVLRRVTQLFESILYRFVLIVIIPAVFTGRGRDVKRILTRTNVARMWAILTLGEVSLVFELSVVWKVDLVVGEIEEISLVVTLNRVETNLPSIFVVYTRYPVPDSTIDYRNAQRVGSLGDIFFPSNTILDEVGVLPQITHHISRNAKLAKAYHLGTLRGSFTHHVYHLGHIQVRALSHYIHLTQSNFHFNSKEKSTTTTTTTTTPRGAATSTAGR
jgi:hypothetical protein